MLRLSFWLLKESIWTVRVQVWRLLNLRNYRFPFFPHRNVLYDAFRIRHVDDTKSPGLSTSRRF